MTEEQVKKLIKDEITNRLDISVYTRFGDEVVVSLYYNGDLIAKESVQIERR